MHTIIPAGGFNTRFFPLSRSSFPKQFIPLINNTSLFQKTVQHALIFSKFDEIYIVTNKDHKYLVADQLLDIGVIDADMLHEPMGKNTLPTIYYAVSEIAKKDSEGIIFVLSSDQLLETSETYDTAVCTAEKLSKEYIVTFGVVPTCPDTGYGYIKPRKVLEGGFMVAAFKEKPDFEMAKEYVTPRYLWNAGIFCFSVNIFLKECSHYALDIVRAFSEEDIASIYAIVPKISIDYGILEKSSKVAVVPLNLSWDDVGSFSAFYEVHEKDENENAVVAKGNAVVTNGDAVNVVKVGESTFILSGMVHRLANEGDEDLEVIEVQNGKIISEDDIIQVEDKWRRDLII